jgi:hypothetical protein
MELEEVPEAETITWEQTTSAGHGDQLMLNHRNNADDCFDSSWQCG